MRGKNAQEKKRPLERSVLSEILQQYKQHGIVNLDNYSRTRLRNVNMYITDDKYSKIDWEVLRSYFGVKQTTQFHLVEETNIIFDEKRIEIKTIYATEDYLHLINDLSKNKSGNMEIFYRGQRFGGLGPIPGVYREKEWKKNEDNLFKEMVLYNPSSFSYDIATFDKLAKMQHYSLPTRLLDITTNPLIALYFACRGFLDKKSAGEVLVFNVPQSRIKYSDSDTVSVLANIAKMRSPMDLSDIYKEIIDKCLKDTDPLENCDDCEHRLVGCGAISRLNEDKSVMPFLLHEIKYEKAYFLSRIYPSHLNNHSVVVIPKHNNERLVRQSGAFLLFGIKKDKAVCADITGFFYRQNDKILRVFVPYDYKKGILEELERLNIHEGTLFPELDMVAAYLRNTKYNR